MSKFLDLVKENTPGEEQESLADKFHRFADKVSALEGGTGDIDVLLSELNDLNEELTTLGGIPEVEGEEDFESPALAKKRAEKLEKDDSMLGKAAKALQAGKDVKSASDPARPTRGVKQIDKSVNKMAKAVSGAIDRVTKQLR